ncbi:hypothetical protein ZEAMMB73_Zm00001d030806 [Zea mays]|uniref:Uncharacterized protein n=1 Tax=Zea mays TaxID=4577 RepID=A0A1D6KEJ4_MAIZE|nr:hypothetical protein ZEAMMB73_Zm00001d030806 [Zea mays]
MAAILRPSVRLGPNSMMQYLTTKEKVQQLQLNLHPKGSNMDLCVSKKGRTQDLPTTEDFLRLSAAF